ncbi:MAG TPA: deaminase domain-containing protein [Kiritimatiellia bacterium]|nr:deaminase domain-containing protein [Kiritimatiellia bacterium]
MNQRLKFWGLAIVALSAWGAASALAAKPKAAPEAVIETAACPPADVAVRKPVIRHVDRAVDGADLKRIWFWRKKLPEQFYRRNNFGWAWAEIEGLEKKEYFAHSGIQSLEGFSSVVARRLEGMSFSPPKGQAKFQTLLVDWRGNLGGRDALPRWFDTEFKMLEDVASRLPDTSVSGKIRLYTNLEPCPSCRGVMDQFLAVYTNVEMEVIYEWPP